MAEEWPDGSDGKKLFATGTVRIHSVPDDSVKCMFNGQTGVCERYDRIVKRVYVKVNTGESLAFSPTNLELVAKAASAVPRSQVSQAEADRPRGSGGCVLCPGTIVRIHGLGKAHQSLNGQEAVCEFWDSETKLMFVRLRSGGGQKAISNKKLRKVCLKEKDALGPEAQKVLEIFQENDTDGDGLIDYLEFGNMLKSMGMGTGVLQQFLAAVDKNGDDQIMFEEFLEWVLSPVRADKSRFELYWPAQNAHPVAAEDVYADDDGDDDDELSMDDVLKICKGNLPDGWPSHGLAVLNNMHARFPDYPVEGIVFMMGRNDFIGGKVGAAIRATGATENETVRPGAIKIQGAFPATYQNVCATGHLNVYEETMAGWSFRNMRDSKVNAIGRLAAHENFRVREVRRGSEYGFCFGRIDWPQGKHGVNYWVVLGLEAHSSLRPDRDYVREDSEVVQHLNADKLHFSDARRLR